MQLGGQVDISESGIMEVKAKCILGEENTNSNGDFNMDTSPDPNGQINTGTSVNSGTSFGSATGSANPVLYIVQAVRHDRDHGSNSSAGSSSGAYPDVVSSFSWTCGNNLAEYMDLEANFYTPTAASSGYGSNLGTGFGTSANSIIANNTDMIVD
ncbi:hypothetical protein GGI17_005771 [Coemansia sp. S146]|nr:hypothetical protein GGI17_005771 [Coemansia sp. S146]